MSKSSPNAAKLRLDDLFRTVVHLRPEVAFDVITPDLFQGVRSAVSFTRLDTQLAPARYLPDIAYLLDDNEEPAVVVVEGQGQASASPRSRATTIAMDIGNAAPVGTREFELHLVEVRTQARFSPNVARLNDESTRLRFLPSNAVLDLEPTDARFQAPETWLLLAFSQKVSAEHLDQLMARLAAIVQPDRSRANTVTSKDVHLLGAISRVRFPEYPWSHQSQESYVNDTQTIETSDSGHLTEEEILQLEIQAANERRRVLAEMEAAAEARGMEQGAELAERALLMKLAEKLAPERLVELAAFESVAELEREVMALVPGKG